MRWFVCRMAGSSLPRFSGQASAVRRFVISFPPTTASPGTEPSSTIVPTAPSVVVPAREPSNSINRQLELFSTTSTPIRTVAQACSFSESPWRNCRNSSFVGSSSLSFSTGPLRMIAARHFALLCKHPIYDLPRNIRQPKRATLKPIGQPHVVEAEQAENCSKSAKANHGQQGFWGSQNCKRMPESRDWELAPGMNATEADRCVGDARKLLRSISPAGSGFNPVEHTITCADRSLFALAYFHADDHPPTYC